MSDRYGKSYARLGWKNKTEPALNDVSLNKMDYALNEVDNRTIELDSIKLDVTDANGMITGFAVNEKTGIITVTYYNGATKSIPTNLNQISTNWDFDKKSQKIIIYLESGDTKETDLSSFITNYEFVDSDTVYFIINEDGTVSADIKKGTITEDKLQPNFLADIRLEAAKAEQAGKEAETAETSAQYYSSLALSYTNGLSGIRECEGTDCAKYYKERAEEAAVRAEQVSDISIATQERAGIVKPDGITITVDGDGTLHGTNIVEADGQTIEKTDNNILKIADALKQLIDNSVQQVKGKGLSENDFTNVLLEKLNSIEKGAQVNPVPVNNLLATVPGTPLDAVQGKVLGDYLDSLNANLTNITNNLNNANFIKNVFTKIENVNAYSCNAVLDFNGMVASAYGRYTYLCIIYYLDAYAYNGVGVFIVTVNHGKWEFWEILNKNPAAYSKLTVGGTTDDLYPYFIIDGEVNINYPVNISKYKITAIRLDVG